jgi:hypothetical protein
MQSPTTTNSSTSSAPSQPNGGERSSQGHSAQTAANSTRFRGSRTKTKWLEDKLTATGLDTNFRTTREHGPIIHLFELILLIHPNTSNGTSHIV